LTQYSDSSNKRKRRIRIAEIILLLAILAFCIQNIFFLYNEKDVYQWDFKTYYYSAKLFLDGSNPYDLQILSDVSGSKLKQHYVYPPVTLWLFAPLSKLDYHTAYDIYLSFKLIILMILIFIWRNYFLNKKVDTIFYVILLFGFSASIYLDIKSGNISIFEQFFLWSSFYWLLKRRPFVFCFPVILISLFKIFPILFIFLAPVFDGKRGWRILALSIGIFSSVTILNLVLYPDLFAQWISIANLTFERGHINPTTFSMIQSLIEIPFGRSNPTITEIITFLLFGFFVIIALLINLKLGKRIKYNQQTGYEMIIIFLFCITYALVMPRFKDYSYILLLVPAYFIIKNDSRTKTYFFLAFILIMTRNTYFQSGVAISNFLWDYYSLFILYLIWGLYLINFRYESGHVAKNEAHERVRPG